MYEYIKSRVRVYLRILLPIESNYKRVHIYFNMHFKSDDQTTTYSTLYPINTIHDVAKVFFTIVRNQIYIIFLGRFWVMG